MLFVSADRVRADLGPVDVGAEIHATMEAAALKALSIIDSASKLSEDVEKELDGIDGLSKVRIRRQFSKNNFAVSFLVIFYESNFLGNFNFK